MVDRIPSKEFQAAVRNYGHEYYLRNRQNILKKQREWYHERGGRAITLQRKAHLKDDMTLYKEYREKRKLYEKRWKEQNHERLKKWSRDYAKKMRLEVLEHYGGIPPKCVCCGQIGIEFLTMDHINNDGAKHMKAINGRSLTGWLRAQGFPTGFQVLCWNCNEAKKYRGYCPHKGKPIEQAI